MRVPHWSSSVAVTVNAALVVAVPLGVVTLILPLVAPTGTLVVIFKLDITLKLAVVPLNLTAVAPFKFKPEIVIFLPTSPCFGLNDEIFGTANNDACDPTATASATETAPSAALIQSQSDLPRLPIGQAYALSA